MVALPKILKKMRMAYSHGKGNILVGNTEGIITVITMNKMTITTVATKVLMIKANDDYGDKNLSRV